MPMKKFANIINSMPYFFMAFLMIFGPNIPQLRGFGDSSFLICALLILFAFIKGVRFNSKIWVLVLPLFPLFLFLAFRSSLSLPGDLSFYFGLLLKPVRILGVFIGAYCLVVLVQKKDIRLSLLHWVFYAISIHALIMVLQLLSVDFKDFIYGYLNSGFYRSTFDYQFRMGGLSGGSGGAVLSVVQSIGFILMPFVLSTKQTRMNKMFIYACGSLCFISVVICGRSGLLSILIFYPLAVVMLSKNTFKTFLKLLLLGLLFFLLIFGLLLFIEVFTPGGAEDNGATDSLAMSLTRTLDSISLMVSSGVVKDGTFSTLLGHIVLPSSTLTLLLGDPATMFVDQLSRDVDSDIGYIRNLWGMGVVGSLVYWSPLILMQLKLLLSKNHTNVKSAALIVGFIMIFFHAKELFYYVRMLFPIYCILFFQSHLTRKVLAVDKYYSRGI